MIRSPWFAATGIAIMLGIALGTWLALGLAMGQTPRSKPNTIAGYLVVAVCGTLPAPAYVAGSYAAPTIDITGKLCVSQ